MKAQDHRSDVDPGRNPEHGTSALKRAVRKLPLIGSALAGLYVWISGKTFTGSADYWEQRYRKGGSSGSGSYGELAMFKAEFLNDLVAREAIGSVVEFGCGDGNQLKLARYPAYLGLDVSQRAVETCRSLFAGDATKRFMLSPDYDGEAADLAISLDVIFHLVEDPVFEEYMRSLFAAARRLVVIYATNTQTQESPRPPHVRHRRFTDWIEQNAPEWELREQVGNRVPYDPDRGLGSPAAFFVYARK